MLKTLCFSRNMESYRSASYYQDVMDELAKQAEVQFYGPGFLKYNQGDSINDILAKAPFEPDLIVVCHAWLNDWDGAGVDPHPKLELSKTSLPKFAILNKEYTNLNAKLDYMKRSEFDLCFTHHHDVEQYWTKTGIEFVFWPFAFCHRRFGHNIKEKTIDVAFSGILQNQNSNAQQTNVRWRIMKEFFHCIGDLPVAKRGRYRSLNIYWNAVPRKNRDAFYSYTEKLFARYRYRYIAPDEYSLLQRKTKAYINALSPMGLVSPRYFENMASMALVFCEESSLYKNIFPDDVYVTYRNDLSDFREKLFYYLDNKGKREEITNRAYRHVVSNHTWETRVRALLLRHNCSTTP